jgi:hypothetical protein
MVVEEDEREEIIKLIVGNNEKRQLSLELP